MKIANIVYENELVNHTQVEYVNYYKGIVEYDKLDKSLPTLYVGWVFMKNSNPDNEIIKNADILKKKIITNELYWEYSFDENKTSHIKGVEGFINYAPQFYFSPKYQYINLDPIFFQIGTVEDLLDVLPKKIDVKYNHKNEMLYVLKDNKIWGINLKMYEYFKFNTYELLAAITERCDKSINDLDGEIYQSYYKIFPNYTHLKRYIVSILSK